MSLAPTSARELTVVGLGGGCHWCTEAVFQSLRGVKGVEQGWIRSESPHDAESEAVRVTFDPGVIGLDTLVEVHLRTHSSTSAHAMRGTYRSAVYTTGPAQRAEAERVLAALGEETGEAYVTKVLPLAGFRLNDERYLDYYRTRPDAPFCTTYISPKLRALRETHAPHVRPDAALDVRPT